MNLFEALQTMNESIDLGENQSIDDTCTHYVFNYNNQEYSFSECSNEYKATSCRNKDYLTGIYPYDEAEHPWAYSNHDSSKWIIIKAGKAIDKVDSNDLEAVVKLLQKHDKDVEQRIDRS